MPAFPIFSLPAVAEFLLPKLNTRELPRNDNPSRVLFENSREAPHNRKHLLGRGICAIVKSLLKGIDHIQIAAPVGSEPEARNFFGDLLGLEEIEKPEPLRARGGCWFKIGNKQLHIGVEQDFHPARKAHPAFSVDDIDHLFEKLSKAGIRCAWDNALDVIKRFYADDPWGNRLEFTEPTS